MWQLRQYRPDIFQQYNTIYAIDNQVHVPKYQVTTTVRDLPQLTIHHLPLLSPPRSQTVQASKYGYST